MTPGRLALGLIAFVYLTGCATDAPPQASGEKPWPTPPPDGYALVFLFTERHDGLRTQPTLHVEGTKLLTLPNDSYTWFHVRPGMRIVRLMWGDRYSGLNLHAQYDLKPGQTLFLRMDTRTHRSSPSDSTSSQVMAVSEQVARQAAANAVYRPAPQRAIE